MIALAALAGPAVSGAGAASCFPGPFGTVDNFLVSTPSSPQFENATFSIMITARSGISTCTAFAGTVNLTISGGVLIFPPVSDSFSAGVLTAQSVIVSGTGTAVSITATETGGTASGSSGTFDVNTNTADAATKLTLAGPSTVSANTISGVFTVELNDGNSTASNGTASTGNTYPVVLTSDSPGTVTFYKGSTGTTVLSSGCTTIPKGQTSVTFRYKDDAPSMTRMITASNITLTVAPTPCKTGTPNLTTVLTPDPSATLDVQVAPKSVTISGVGFGIGGTVEWGTTTLSSSSPTDMCATTLPVANTPPCLKPWPANGKSVTLIPPPGDLGTTVGVTVNGGVASAEADNYLTTKARFYYGPLVADVSPLSGDALGGTPVTISGIDLGPKPVVNFGSVPIDTGDDTQKCGASGAPPQTACWKSNNATKIVVLAPASTGTALVTVEGGVVHDEADNTFRYGTAVITGLKALS